MSINRFLVRESDSLDAALKTMDANGLGLAFAVDGGGRLSGVIGASDIDATLARGGSFGGQVSSAMRPDPGGLPVDADPAQIAKRMNGKGYIVPLVDRERRPVDFVSPARMRRIPVAEPVLTGNELKYLSECVTTSWISSQGPFVRRFENEFARLIDARNALAVSNGTVALHLALLAFGIGPGDEVIVPDLTFAATANAVIHAGATPVIVDVGAESWNLDPEMVAAAITPRTRAIMPVHLYGQPAEMDALMELAERHGLIVIEDAAEAVGARYKGRPCGSIGHAGAFSFFSNKLITTGEGGMVVFQDAQIAERARILRDHGMNPGRRYWHDEVGYNYRLTNMQAAIGCAQVEQMGRFFTRKMEIAAAYRARLTGIDGLRLPTEIPGRVNSYWMFSVICDLARLGLARDDIVSRLANAGIETRPLFYPLHTMPPYRGYAGNREFPNASHLSDGGLSLPSSITLTDAEIDYICGVIARLYGTRRLVQRAASA